MEWREEIHNADSLTNACYVAEECYRQTGKEYKYEEVSHIWFHG
jgi:hypothetical protein